MGAGLPTPRYEVTELEGYNGLLGTHVRTAPGLSCMVVDTWYARRVVATYRSEDRLMRWRDGGPAGTSSRGHKGAREAAASLARSLEALYGAPV